MALWSVIVALMLLWFLGLLANIGGNLNIILLIVALILLLVAIGTGRRIF